MGVTAAALQNQQIRERDVVAGTLLGVAGLSVLTGAALVLWPETAADDTQGRER